MKIDGYEFTEKEIKAMKALRRYLGFTDDQKGLEDDIGNDHLTLNPGRSGRLYACYLDEANDAACWVDEPDRIFDCKHSAEDKSFMEAELC